jgi:aryl-alcohol dehydrogenase-like predicted oxidoreductase
MKRREAMGAMAAVIAAGGCGEPRPADSASASAPAAEQPRGEGGSAALRPLGKTGWMVEPVSMGGEGVLRTSGRAAEAVPVVLEALRLGVRYCDTAPAYAQSQDYYGEGFRRAGAGARDGVLLASKTHDRSRDGSLRLLDDSLKRLGTDRLDLWQLHDLRDQDDLDRIFGRGGAIEAVERAKADGRVRFVGVTGHHHPAILVEAMRRYPVDTVLCAINPADPRKLPFLSTVVPEARRRGVGIIGMKVLARGELLQETATLSECVRYAASHADTLIVGFSSPAEVRAGLAAGRAFAPMAEADQRALEARVAPEAHRFDTFKA